MEKNWRRVVIEYTIRRLFLMVPTFLGTTFLVFVILSYVPGGPFEKAVMQLKQMQMDSGEAGFISNTMQSGLLSPDVLDALKHQFGLDKPLWKRYLIWLGVWKRELKEKEVFAGEPFREDIRYVFHENFIYSIQRWVKAEKQGGKWAVLESGVGSDFKFCEEYDELPDVSGIVDWEPSKNWIVEETGDDKCKLVQKSFSGILTGDLGYSYVYDESVWELIKARLPVSSYFGIIGFILSYFISIPLGIVKALKHGSKFDFLSSATVFIGYSIPGFVLGALLLVYFGGGSFWNVFPLGGFVSEHWSDYTFWGKIKDVVHHTFLPVIAYSIGSFATLTVLMKNSIIENLSKDYVRTAFAKGLDGKRVIFVHVLRNSLIPLATGIGHIIGIFLAGSYLIEKVFNIDGIGMLSFKSILSADYPVIMGFLVINTIILLIGNLISDFIYSIIDPRIRFH